MGDDRTLFWVVFNVVVVVLLVLDLAVFHRKSHVIRIKEALIWSAFWIALAIVFGGFLWWWLGSAKGLEYFTGYINGSTINLTYQGDLSHAAQRSIREEINVDLIDLNRLRDALEGEPPKRAPGFWSKIKEALGA